MLPDAVEDAQSLEHHIYNVTMVNHTSAVNMRNATADDLANQSPTSRCIEGITASPSPQTPRDHDALLYIVVVLLFYAFSMVILMVKYIRRERQEAEMDHYYSEFVSRDRFKAPIFEIKRCMTKILGTSPARLERVVDEDEEFVSCLDLSVAGSNTFPDVRSSVIGRQSDHCS